MAVTSVVIGTLELLTPTVYHVGQDTYYALSAGVQRQPRLVEMAGRYPAYVGGTDQARSIPLLVMLLGSTAALRIAAYEDLLAELNVPGLISLTWTEDGVTRRYWCHVESVEPSHWMTKASVSLVAPRPDAEVI